MATQRQIEANRLNAQKSTGPRTEAGKEVSRTNAIDHGLTGEGVVILEERKELIAARAAAFAAMLGGRELNAEEAMLAERVALESVRATLCQEREDRIFLEESLDAEHNWADAQRFAAEELARGLSRRPELITRQLEATSHGCALKIEQWELLLAALDTDNAPWEEDQRKVAFDLLGVPRVFRRVSRKIDPPAGGDTVAHQRATATAELERLRGKKERWLDGFSEFKRAQTIQGHTFPRKEVWQIRRYEAACNRRFQAAFNELMRLGKGQGAGGGQGQGQVHGPAEPSKLMREERAAFEAMQRERAQFETSKRVRQSEAEIKALIDAPASTPKTPTPTPAPTPTRQPDHPSKDAREHRRQRRADQKRRRQARKR